MGKTILKSVAILGLFGLAACESSDLPRAGIGAGAGYLADRALGGDGMVGAAVGATAGVVCDDVTPGVCR
ncbi:complement resistance protein TraT [Citreicella sp. C3M06]|uniref:complement resistance protein TraT n=1 Tax=Roseobacteraceae TaxID=2854170 RepID=UPI001C095B67|nr:MULTISPECIES: complement resistance protein TraT [Roseobacteraceae]MBU2962707.1 complement resistance protein TraT [Citreicella sp. C3M06]MDO6586801.1 complement resistance protein TraT [Salipiger sp. 1_MG-2023]